MGDFRRLFIGQRRAHDEVGRRPMLTRGLAKRVTIFVNEETRHHMSPLHDAVMNYLMKAGVAGATATRGYSGFGWHHALHTPKIEVLAEHLPIKIEFVDTPE